MVSYMFGCCNNSNISRPGFSPGPEMSRLVLCRDRFLARRDKLRLGLKNRDGSRRDSRQRKTYFTAKNGEKEFG